MDGDGSFFLEVVADKQQSNKRFSDYTPAKIGWDASKSWLSDFSVFNRELVRIKEVTNEDEFGFYVARSLQAEGERRALALLNKRTGLDVAELTEKGVAQAVGRRAGFELTTLSDVEQAKKELIAAVVLIAYRRAGFEPPDELTIDAVIKDAEKRIAAQIEKYVEDFVIHALDTIADDIINWACDRIAKKVGLRLSNPLDKQAVKNDVVNWGFDRVRRKLGITNRGGGLKMTKQAIRNRTAQRKFYAAHGNRKKYESVKGG